MRQAISNSMVATAAAIIIMVSGGVMSARTVSAGPGITLEGSVADTVSAAVEGVRVSGARIERSGEYLRVGLDLDLRDLTVTAGRAVLLTPRIATETDSLDLPSVGVYGRTRYYFYVRNGRSMLTEGEESYRWKDRPDSLSYSQVIELPSWAVDRPLQLRLRRSEYGCCGTLLGQAEARVAAETVKMAECFPATVIREEPLPAEAVREHSISGSAFIDYPVDRSDIREDYLNNMFELSRIRASIDSVKSVPDIVITGIRLKGFASPEGPYGHNAVLAKARTESLKSFIQSLYDFEDGLIETDFEAEDWTGLREYVDASDLNHRNALLDIIDSDLDPDTKDYRIRQTYPAEYRFLLENVYPYLRRTDYRISYIIREQTVGESSGTTDQEGEKMK